MASAWFVPACPGTVGGFLSVIGPKGKNGFGVDIKTETLLRVRYLFDIGDKTGFKAGVAYEYWRNMFGNDASKDGSRGSKASTPMLVGEYHF